MLAIFFQHTIKLIYSQFNSFLAALEAHGLAEELAMPGDDDDDGDGSVDCGGGGGDDYVYKQRLLLLLKLFRHLDAYFQFNQIFIKQAKWKMVMIMMKVMVLIMTNDKDDDGLIAGAITVFAPTDEAMARLDEETRAKVFTQN